MKITIDKNGFKEAFKNNFSCAGLNALYDHLMSIKEGPGIDVIALCCDFTEYENLKEFQSDYDAERYPDVESIEAETYVIRFSAKSFIVLNF